jgi:hypothetical protein
VRTETRCSPSALVIKMLTISPGAGSRNSTFESPVQCTTRSAIPSFALAADNQPQRGSQRSQLRLEIAHDKARRSLAARRRELIAQREKIRRNGGDLLAQRTRRHSVILSTAVAASLRDVDAHTAHCRQIRCPARRSRPRRPPALCAPNVRRQRSRVFAHAVSPSACFAGSRDPTAMQAAGWCLSALVHA